MKTVKRAETQHVSLRFILSVVCTVFLLLIFTRNLFSDEIKLKSGIVIRGKISQVSENYIEYDPEGSRTFDIVERDLVVEIVYDDGTSIKMAP